MKYTPGHDLVCFDVLRVDASGQLIKPMHEQIAYNQTITDKSILFQINVVAFWNKLWRKSLIDQAGLIFPGGMVYEDTAFYFKYVAITKSAIFIPFNGYNYVMREGSIMDEANKKASKVYDYIKISVDAYNFYHEHNLLNEYKDAMLWFWKKNFSCAEHILPQARLDEYKAATKEALRQLTGPKDFLCAGMKEILHITSDWKKRFYTSTSQTRTYRFFGIPLLSIKQTIPFQQDGSCHYSDFSLKLLGISLLKRRRNHGATSVRILGVRLYNR